VFSKIEESFEADIVEYSKRHELAAEINDELLKKGCKSHGTQ